VSLKLFLCALNILHSISAYWLDNLRYYKIGYRSSVVQSGAGKVSCNKSTRQQCSVAPAPKLSAEQKSSFPLIAWGWGDLSFHTGKEVASWRVHRAHIIIVTIDYRLYQSVACQNYTSSGSWVNWKLFPFQQSLCY